MDRGSHLLKRFTLDTSSTNVTTSYVQLSATGLGSGQPGTKLVVSNSGAQVLSLGYGASSAEQDLALIPASGMFRHDIILVPASNRLALKSMGSTQSSGIVVIDVYG